MSDDILDDVLFEYDAALRLGVCKRTLKRWRDTGQGPIYGYIGRRVIYLRANLNAWVLRHQRDPGAR
jgi:hypothetical protein